MSVSFRLIRRLWTGLIAILSLACIGLSLHLYTLRLYAANILGALTGIPATAFVGALWTISRKFMFGPQCVATEITWVFVLVPFEILLGMFSLYSEPARNTKIYVEYMCLEWFMWAHVTCVVVYAVTLIVLAITTQVSYDRNVWTRDIDSSPSPFPFPVIIAHAFPCMAQRFLGPGASESVRANEVQEYCMPGCTCQRKLHTLSSRDLTITIARGSMASFESRSSQAGSVRSNIPVRIPTSMDRHKTTMVTLPRQPSPASPLQT